MPSVRRQPEPELSPPPRALELDREGAREVASAAALTAAGLAATIVFFSAAQRPAWLWAIFAIFAALGLYLAFRFAGVWTSRLTLVREGVAVNGVVIEKVPEPKGRSRFVVWYTVDDQQWSVEGSGMHVLADVGDAVTVLHEPGNPSRSIIYRLVRCKARDSIANGPAAPAAQR